MSEFVVYEDTPFADYLQSIDSVESTVKPARLQLAPSFSGHGRPTWSTWSANMRQYWRQSLIHDTFSVSLPAAEETAFEEKFQYLIVTSALLNETLSVHPKKHLADTSPFHATHSRTTQVGTVATFVGLVVAMGAEKLTRASAAMTTVVASGVAIFFAYRQTRRIRSRALYTKILAQLQHVMAQCDALDAKVHRALMTIQEIELVSRGFRLSTPLSPITRIEQNSKTRRCVVLRQRLAALLRRAFIAYEEAIIDLKDLVSKRSLGRFYGLYNIRSVASLSSAGKWNEDDDEDTAVTLEYLRTLAQLMHSKRRECMVQLLALNMLSEPQSTKHPHHNVGWRAVDGVLDTLAKETTEFVAEVQDAVQSDLYQTPLTNRSSEANMNDDRLRPFIHRLASLGQHVRTIEAKLYLCNDEIRQMTESSEKVTRARLEREFASLQQDISQLAQEWDIGHKALVDVFDPPKAQVEDTLTLHDTAAATPEKEGLPSPLPSPTWVELDTSESDLLPMPARASILEVTVEEAAERRASRTSRKSREERIAEQKAKRVLEAQERAQREQPEKMVRELKGVLDRRAVELDLNHDDEHQSPEKAE